jgi:hypothetical protein
LKNRHQVDDGSRFDKRVYTKLKQQALTLVEHCEPITKLSVANGYSGAKRQAALEAIASLKEEELGPRDARLKMFLKDDKYHTDEMKAPRCIQYRDKRYALTLAQFTYPIEHKIYNRKHEGLRRFAKGRNLEQRAKDLRAMWDSYGNPMAWLLDHSKFDAHVSVELIKIATALNSACYKHSGQHDYVRWLMRMQIDNKGITKNGTKYRTRGTRMSGDQNTGLDNSTLNLSMIELVLKWCGVKGSVYVDGDDSVVVLDQKDRHKLNIKLFSRFGMKTKEEFAYCFEHVEFCQTRPVWNGSKYIMCRNPDRVLSRCNWTVKKFPMAKDACYIKSVMMCESALNQGLPVMGPLSSRIVPQLNVNKRYKVMDTELDYMVKALGKDRGTLYTTLDVSEESRLSYQEAWGIDVLTQLELEAMEMVEPSDPFDDMYNLLPGWTCDV